MYQPVHFNQNDGAAVSALIAANPLATLVTANDGGFSADHIPLLFDAQRGQRGVLAGHVARANPIWRTASGQGVLAIFHGPQSYVSPSWYPSKAASAKVVPTWNYAVVHAHGVLRAVDDSAWLHALVTRLTNTHESARTQPWAVTDAPPEYVDQMVRAIVGIEIELTRVEAKWKLSQNRHSADRLGVAAGLAGDNSDQGRAMVRLMQALPGAP